MQYGDLYVELPIGSKIYVFGDAFPGQCVRIAYPNASEGYVCFMGWHLPSDSTDLMRLAGMSLPLLKFSGGSVDDYAICRSS